MRTNKKKLPESECIVPYRYCKSLEMFRTILKRSEVRGTVLSKRGIMEGYTIFPRDAAPVDYIFCDYKRKPDSIDAIAKSLEIVHRAKTNQIPQLPMHGKMISSFIQERNPVFFPVVLTTCSTENPVSVTAVMAYENVSPVTFLSRGTLDALGIPCENVFETRSLTKNFPCEVKIQGLSLNVYPSQGHFQDLDILGQDFLLVHGLQLTVRGQSQTATIELEKQGQEEKAY